MELKIVKRPMQDKHTDLENIQYLGEPKINRWLWFGYKFKE